MLHLVHYYLQISPCFHGSNTTSASGPTSLTFNFPNPQDMSCHFIPCAGLGSSSPRRISVKSLVEAACFQRSFNALLSSWWHFKMSFSLLQCIQNASLCSWFSLISKSLKHYMYLGSIKTFSHSHIGHDRSAFMNKTGSQSPFRHQFT